MTRIRHIAIASRDPGKAADFYTANFGWTELSRRGDPKDPSRNSAVTLTDGHINISIIDFRVDQIGKGLDYEGLHHIGVVVDDVDAWQAHLEAGGTPCVAGRDEIPPGAHFEIKFRGPDDVVFDISDRPWPGAAEMETGEVEDARQRRSAPAAV